MSLEFLQKHNRGRFRTKSLIYIIMASALTFYTLVATGCISNSPGIPNLYLFSLKVTDKAGPWEAQFGYFGVCLQSASGLNCGSTQSILKTADMVDQLQQLADRGRLLQSKIFLALFVAAGIFFFIGLVALLDSTRSSQRSAAQQRRSKQITMIGLWSAGALALASSTAVAMAVGGLQYLSSTTSSNIEIKARIALQVLQWMAFASTVLVGVGATSMLSTSDGNSMIATNIGRMPAPPPSFSTSGNGPPPPPPPGS